MIHGKIYIATRLHNATRAKEIKAKLELLGFEITYDWTSHGQVFNDEELAKYAIQEENGVKAADVVLLVQPGGCGSHWEAGYARGLGKPIIILMEAEVEKKTFYYLNDNVYRVNTESEAIQQIIDVLGMRRNYV